MSTQFSNPECGHWQTDDAPCNCHASLRLEPGWLQRQAEKIAVDSATWPAWMRGNQSDSTLTDEQRAEAAKILRDRADELYDSPCNCRVRDTMEHPPITTAMPIEDAQRAKWESGRKLYGPEFVGDPLQELYCEYIDALNYIDELVKQGRSSDQIAYCRMATRRLAEIVREEARR